ncbi:helix-turn-helix transcriptional regulator [Azotobacter chroococcum]|uniref:AlpA family transcriptional regulator n=1 Tax=Azotobacter chroococcum TaxID=353 RepID=A0A4R1PI39_9GAMM|nr:AlpA family phage regulatory protein [Azotobacter chroococcum]TBV97744.1 AlpA family phage regulatory protein [Azotobacter chroococcum]TCL28168.1 AlpA family transcriptional regulator [Azotobacter chroococcum]
MAGTTLPQLHQDSKAELERRAEVTKARRFIKLPEVRRLTTLSTSEIYRRIAAGTFPAQIMLGPKSAVWIEAEVLAWCDERIAESRGEVA